MTSILGWVLVTVGGYNGGEVSYSAQLTDLESCQRLQESIKLIADLPDRVRTRCVQIKVPL